MNGDGTMLDQRLRILSNRPAEGAGDFFARQKLIDGWDQLRISSARVMVVGAGALGNETIKNLVLLGFGNLLICDFDHVEDSNLSRTVLFGKEDIGKRKAEAAAEKARVLSLSDNPNIGWVHDDITTGLGLGLFSEFDVVLCCLDNIHARLFINRCCLRTGTKWIDSGINGLSGHVMAFAPPEGACYECGLSAHQFAKGRERFACGLVKRRNFEAGKVATVQVTSSIIAGMLTQECLKVLFDNKPSFGKRIFYQGAQADLDSNNLKRRESCDAHATLPAVRDVALGNAASLQDLLLRIETDAGPGVVLDLHDRLYQGFVRTHACSLCGKQMDFYRAIHELFDTDLYCADHGPEEISNSKAIREPQGIASFSLHDTESRILNMSLAQLGIPRAHILTFRGRDNTEFAVRLAADLHGYPGLSRAT